MRAGVDCSIDEALETRYRARSLWLDGCPGSLAPRASLPGDVDCDVAIVGAGFTGLWTAYWLATLSPGMRIAVIEAEVAGFGASGRNAGFVSAGIAGEPRVYARTHGIDAVRRAERVVIDAIDEIGRILAEEGIDCGYVKNGSFRIATSQPQLDRLRSGLRSRRERGLEEDDARELGVEELREHVRIEGVLGATYTPHCARVDPARLVRGLAGACERHGVRIYERTPASTIEPGRVACGAGIVRAEVVVLATESYTTQLPGERRRYLPIFSHMIATEPLPPETWAEIGWERAEPFADQRYLFLYGQRTPDGRIALGGRGAPYRIGGAIREQDETRKRIHDRLVDDLRRHFPAAADARVTHRWGGPFASPRDWSMTVQLDRVSGLAVAGGLSGHGIVGSHVAGRTLADLVLGRDTDLTTMPWVGHRSPRWEPEPLRWLAATAIARTLDGADRHEQRTGRAARRVRLVRRWLPGR